LRAGGLELRKGHQRSKPGCKGEGRHEAGWHCRSPC
jgi:hypothetical protein